MPRQDIAQGLFLAVVSLAFGAIALRYPVGTLTRIGPGFFPLVISGALLVLAAAMLVRAGFTASAPLQLKAANIAIIMASLGAFVLASKLVGMAAGIAALVFVSAFAGTSYSWKRCLVVTLVLIAVAFGFEHVLGLRLRLL